MNRIEQLIEELCPNGVEYKELGEVCNNIFAGGTPRTSNKEYYNGTIPWLRSGEINFNVITKTEIFISEIGLNNSSARRIRENSVLIAMTGATVARTGINKIPLTANQSVCALETNDEILNYKFLYYLLSKDYLKLKNLGQGVLTSMNLQIIKAIQIPLPPLPVQQEIVTILDTFTALDASLQAELEARRKQYEHYRNQLLNFEGKEVEWKALGEVCEFVRGPFGGAIKKNCFVASGYAIYEQQHAIYGNTDIRYFISDDKFKELKRFEVFPGDLIMSCSGTMGKIAIIPENAPKGVINQALLKLTVKNEISAKYLKYYFENTITQQMNDEARGGAIKNVASVDVLKKIKMPVPPLSEQERIVGILDKFDALLNTELPAEIAARRKQYEYYREKLLTFEPLAN